MINWEDENPCEHIRQLFDSMSDKVEITFDDPYSGFNIICKQCQKTVYFGPKQERSQ